MAWIKVYMPDELADAARAEALNLSAITQEAVRLALQVSSVNAWLDSLAPTDPEEAGRAASPRARYKAHNQLWDDI